MEILFSMRRADDIMETKLGFSSGEDLRILRRNLTNTNNNNTVVLSRIYSDQATTTPYQNSVYLILGEL